MTDPTLSLAPHWFGVVAMFAAVALVAVLVAASRLPTSVKLVFYVGLVMRGIGSIVRYRVLFDFYNGSGDAAKYYREGLDIAAAFQTWDFSPIYDPAQWLHGKFLGTYFLQVASGGVLTFLGPHMFMEFLAFALLAYVGLFGFAVAFWRTYPEARPWPYLMWIWLFPSLWYWPSSIGKEAILVLGLGLAVMGFLGRGGRMNWAVLVPGLLITLATRAEVAGVLLVSMLLAQWLSFRGRWTPSRTAQGIVFFAVAVTGTVYAARSAGIDEFDLEGVEEYASTPQATDRGTSVEAVSISPTGVPMAAINVLFRPFPWDATNVMVLASSFELMALWGIVFYRRRAFLRSLRNWRSDRFLSLSVVFIVIYSIALGLTVVNLGIIARQRIFLFPFVFLLLEAQPREASRSEREGTRRRRVPGRRIARRPARIPGRVPALTGAPR